MYYNPHGHTPDDHYVHHRICMVTTRRRDHRTTCYEACAYKRELACITRIKRY